MPRKGDVPLTPLSRCLCLQPAESVCTDLKSPGTAPVSVLPPIVAALTAESSAAGLLNQRWDGMRTGYALDRIQRLFNQRE